ncbi:PAS domain S-box protein [uncultured Propionivibrio sp.]|uniref:sensor histidine kinase n=1 Tax=uncultured Propionivibrio sp. TaxID=426737 RepID=UPI0029C0D87F|nr:PAS domain S-box protein [uncultured Propionivibrio sp.]
MTAGKSGPEHNDRRMAGELERLRTIFNLSPVGIGITRLSDGALVDVNEAFSRLLGFSQSELLGKTSAELGLWADLDERNRVFARIVAGEVIQEMPTRVVRKDRQIHDIKFSATISMIADEKYMVSALRDVTAELRAERERLITERRLQLSLELMPIVVFHQDLDLRYTFIANPLIAVPGDTFLGRFDDELFSPEDAKVTIAIKQRVIERGVGERHEIRMGTGEHTRWYDTLIEPERNSQGAIVGIIGVAADITDRMQREERYRAVLKDQTELIARYRPDGTMLYANEVYCRFFGKSEARIVGHSWQPVAHPDDIALVEAKLAELSVNNPVVLIENRVYSGQGEERWLQFVNRGLYDESGVLREIQSVGRDITERKRNEQALAEYQARIYALLEYSDNLREKQRKDIARDIHDQLGAILTSIGFRIDSLKHRIKDNPAIRNEFDLIRAQVKQANGAARTICTALRPPVLDDLGLSSACQWYMKDWSALVGIAAQGRFNRLSRPCGDQLSTDLFRVFQELLNNVAKHAHANGVKVILSSGRQGLRLRVTDDGRGFVLDEARSKGYGLLGVKERILRHGGQMTIESGKTGTTVTLTIPWQGEP